MIKPLFIYVMVCVLSTAAVSAGEPTFDQLKPSINIGTIGGGNDGEPSIARVIGEVLSLRGYPAKTVTHETLVSLGPDTGCLQEEGKERGITIAIAHVEYETEERHYSLDEPTSHADYVKNMITGAAQVDGAILVVSAADGPTPQTRGDILLARQVGVPAIDVYVDKADEVTPEQVDAVVEEVSEILDAADYRYSHFVLGNLGSALEGESQAVLSILNLVAVLDTRVKQKRDDAFLMPIEDVSTISGRGTVAAGRVERGVVNVGDEVEVVGIETHGVTTVKEVTRLRPLFGGKRRVLVSLAGDAVVVPLEIERGQVLAKPGSITPHTKFEAEVYVLTKEEGGRHTPFFSGYRPQFYFRTTDVTGAVSLPEGTDFLMPGESGPMKIELDTPIAMREETRFAVRQGEQMVGIGSVNEAYD